MTVIKLFIKKVPLFWVKIMIKPGWFLLTRRSTQLQIHDIVISEGVVFIIPHRIRFKKVLYLVINISEGYMYPNRNIIYNYVIDYISKHNTQRNLSMIKREADIFGFLFLGGIATISRTPLLNILVSGKI